MPYFSNEFNPQPPASFTLSSFRGINRALPEEALYRQNGCYTHKGVNFWIEDGGVLRPRNNYKALFGDPITVTDTRGTFTCYVKSAHVFCSKADDATPLWLLGCDMWTGDPSAHHHYALVYGALDGSSWAECKTAVGSVFSSTGEAQNLYFSNADFSFVNFTGNYIGDYTDDSVTVCTNGADIPVAYLPYHEKDTAKEGLYEVKSPGWHECNINTETNVVDWGATTSNQYQIEFFSRTKEMPVTSAGALTEGTLYFMRDKSGTTFKIAATDTGDALDITDAGHNVMARLRISDFSAVSISASSDRVTVDSAHWPSKPKNGDRVQFYAADPNVYPDELAENVIYFCRDVSKYTFKVTDAPKNKAYNMTTSIETNDGLTACRISNGWEDCPKGELVFEHDQRLWMKRGNTIYYSDSFYKTQDWEYAHSRDWSVEIPELRTGSISILTFDGDTIKSAHRYGPENIVHKENSFWRIVNHVPPYAVECVFSVKGTIAPRSVCQWKGNLIYAVADGIQIYNGASSGALLTDEIKGIWREDNDDCICAVCGDTLYVYGNMTNPVTEQDEKGMLAVYLPKKEVCYWTMDTSFPLMNLIGNGDFSGTAGWQAGGAAFAADGGVGTVTGDGTSQYPQIYQLSAAAGEAGDKVYIRAAMTAKNGDCQELSITCGAATVASQASPAEDTQYALGGIRTLEGAAETVAFLGTYATAEGAAGKAFTVDHALAVNLTQAFGKGGEPTAEAFEGMLEEIGGETPWFDGTYDYPTKCEMHCALDPWFTTLVSGSNVPEMWFAMNGRFYKVDTSEPEDGKAPGMVYCLPQNNFGDILRRKTLGRMSVYGRGGTLVYTPIVGTTEKTEKNIALPENPGASRPVHLSLSNVMSAGAKLTNSGGSVPRVHSIQTELSM